MTLLNSSKTSKKRVDAALAADDDENYIPDPEAAEEGDGLDDLGIPEPAPIEGKLLNPGELKAFNDSDEGKNALRIIQGWYEDCKNAMSDRRREWRMHEAFERGRQHIFYDKREETVKDLPRPNGVPRSTVNKCRGVMRTEVAKFTAQKPTATALPASNDEEDVAAARAAEALWESLYRRLDIAAKQRRTARWQSVAGLGYMKPYWDSGRYDAVSKVFGDLAIDAVPPYNVFIPDVYVEDIIEQPYIIHAQLLPTDMIRLRYAEALGDDWEPAPAGNDEATEFGRIHELGSDSKVKQSLLLEVWINPATTADFENGAMLIVVGDRIVEASITGFPPGYTRYPLVKFEHIPTGIYWPACVFDDILPLQRELNRSNGQMIQLKNAMVTNGFFHEDGSIDPDKITTRPGQNIPVLPGYKFPQPIPMHPIPQHLPEILNRTETQMEDISGQHASTNGRHVPGLEAASAIGQLIEQDEAYISPAIASIETGLSVVASIAVTLFSVYATTERVVKIVSEDQGLDVVLMKGADVMGGTDVRMEGSSALPQSKSARQALIIDLAGTGAIPPQDLLKLLEVPQLSNYVNQQMVHADENAARRENIAFKALAKMPEQQAAAYIEAYYADWKERQLAGDPETMGSQVPTDPVTGAPAVDAEPVPVPLQAPGIVPVNEWDDHTVHLYIIDLLIKSQWWASCPKPVKAEVQKHRAAHQAALQRQQMMEQAVAAPTPPAGGAPGAPDSDQPDYAGKTEEQIMEGQ